MNAFAISLWVSLDLSSAFAAQQQPTDWKVITSRSSVERTDIGVVNVFFPIQFPIHDMTDEQEKKWDGEGMGLVFRSSAELQKSVSPGRNREEEEKFVLEELLKVKRDDMDWKRNMLIAIAGGRTPRGQRYEVKIESAKADGKTLTVAYRVVPVKDDYILGKDGGRILLLVPRFDGEVRFTQLRDKK